MQDLLPKGPAGYMSVRSNPPTLNSIFPKPPPVPPPPEKYYAATPVLKTSKPSTPLDAYSDIDFTANNTLPISLNGLLNDNDKDIQIQEFPRDKLVIIEKLGSGVFGELHLCETKGLR